MALAPATVEREDEVIAPVRLNIMGAGCKQWFVSSGWHFGESALAACANRPYT